MINPEKEQSFVEYLRGVIKQEIEDGHKTLEREYARMGLEYHRPRELSPDEALTVINRIGRAIGDWRPGVERMLQNRRGKHS